MQTILLDLTDWDLVLDTNGNIAVASNPYSLAQDAASAIRTFLGECWFDTTMGVPYFGSILGHMPPVAYMKAKFVAAALMVPEIVAARCFLSAITPQRRVSGQVQVTDVAGRISTATF